MFPLKFVYSDNILIFWERKEKLTAYFLYFFFILRIEAGEPTLLGFIIKEGHHSRQEMVVGWEVGA